MWNKDEIQFYYKLVIRLYYQFFRFQTSRNGSTKVPTAQGMYEAFGAITMAHGLINYSKMSPPKKLTCKGTLRQVFICVRTGTPYPLTHSIRVYSILIYTGKGGGRNHAERLEGQQFTKLGRKYQLDWLYLQSVNSEKHLPQSPFTSQFFRWRRHFALPSMSFIFLWNGPSTFLFPSS